MENPLPFSDEQISSCAEVLKHFINRPHLKVLAGSHDSVKEIMAMANKLGCFSRKENKKLKREKREKRHEMDATNKICLSKQNNKKRKLPVAQIEDHTIPTDDTTQNKEFPVSLYLSLDSEVNEGLELMPKRPTLGDCGAETGKDEDPSGDDKMIISPSTKTYDFNDHLKYKNNNNCYICRKYYTNKHSFYKFLCPACGDYNFMKRSLTCDLTGFVAMVTGCRIKIGFEVCLSLLRCGATVHGITRFPKDAAIRYSTQPDYSLWKHRLFLYGLDLRDIPGVHRFCDYFKSKVTNTLHILINNAAQTVRKPCAFYSHLMANEGSILDASVAGSTVVSDEHYAHIGRTSTDLLLSGNGPLALPLTLTSTNDMTSPSPAVSTSLSPSSQPTHAYVNETNESTSRSALLSQVSLLPEDSRHNQSDFPSNVYDEDGQQVDLRGENSWVQRIGQISTIEVMEVHAINALAPWVFISELRPVMGQTEGDKFIINVSAMEGQFYRYKTPHHPHTNMAKAALNMLTRTCAAQFAAESRVFMNAVDTGWITDERPFHMRTAPNHNGDVFECPIDCVDAAMRILDPIYVSVTKQAERMDNQDERGNSLEKPWSGLFLKDYFPTRW